MNNRLLSAAMFAAFLASGSASAQDEGTSYTPRATAPGSETAQAHTNRTEEAREAADQVTAAAELLSSMKEAEGTQSLLEQAQGLFIVPDYGRGAAVVGARGGEGILVVRNAGEWAGPAFYDFGGLSVGAQVGGQRGSMVMFLMSDQAVERFKEDNTDFALTADAGLTIVEYSESAHATLTESDVVVWSDAEGLFGGAAIGVTGIRHDADDNRAYYEEDASAEQIIMGSVTNPHAEQLHEQLPSQVASR